MAKSSEDIVKDLLKEAQYYWYDDNADNVNPLDPNDFDPIVDKIFKANALEIEKLYAEIEESQQELILGLSKVLVPSKFLLPEPGYTIAQLNPKGIRLETGPEDSYIISGQSDTGEKQEYYFSPLFEHDHPKCELLAVLTDSVAIQITNKQSEVIKQTEGKKNTSKIWLGLNVEGIQEGHSISFFLGDNIIDEFDKDYYQLHSGKWLFNGKELNVRTGVSNFSEDNGAEKTLLEVLEITDNYEKHILSHLKNCFIHLSVHPEMSQHKSLYPDDPALEPLYSELKIDNPIYWIKIELSIPIPNDYLIKRNFYPNCLPLVNRRLVDRNVSKRNYDRILLPMPTKDFFLDVYKVQDTRGRADDSVYKQLSFLEPDSRPGTYMLRSGHQVRRLSKQDAANRIHRLLELIQEEYNTFKEEGVNRLKEDFNEIEKAINRIKKNLPKYFRGEEQKMAYFCIANFRPGVNRMYYWYWETQGETIKYLGDQTGLVISSANVKIENSTTIIPIERGKNELKVEDYINQVKTALLSNGRIMTKGDIELYCKSRYGDWLRVTGITQELMVLEEGQLGRALLVQTKSTQECSKAEKELLRVELQNDLNAKSTFFTPIKVVVDDD